MKKINLTLTVLLINMLLLPAFAVDDGSNYFYSSQSVGIQQRVPTATLHVNGTALFDTGAVTFSNASPVTFNDLALVNNALRIPTGATNGYVLTTDALGNASWANIASLPGASDDLGNHTATTDLNLAGNDITNVDDITANRYFGDGSNLTGVNASNGTVNNTTINNGTVNNTTINNPVVNNAYLQDAIFNGLTLFTNNSILNMNNRNIIGASEIHATTFNGGIFIGDGSGLTGVSASNGVVNNTIINNGVIQNTNITNTAIDNSTVTNTEISNSNIKNTKIKNSEFNTGVINDSYINGSYLQDPTINGTATFEENSIAVFQGELMIQTNAGTGKILTSDSEGNARWISATTINTNGDNMGNHTATRELNMASKDISDAGTITANRFDGGVFNGSFTGDGSGLKGINNIFTIVDNAITNNGDAASLNNDFVIGSNTVNFSGESSRLYFDKSKAAFRAGSSNDQQWNDNNVGFGSVAFGTNNIAKGVTSAAFGTTNEATGEYSMTWGQNNTSRGAQSTTWGSLNSANGTASTAWGQQSRAIGAQSTAFGVNNRAEGQHAIAFGANSIASGRDSIAIGYLTKASGDLSVAIGRGNSSSDKFENSINQSLAIGFRSNASTLFVGPGFGGRTLGKVGIGTNTPQDLLDVNGRIRVNQFRMIPGSGVDKVLTSDAIGNATWQSISSIAGSGDNLGDHIATKNLDMGGFNITNVGSLSQKINDLTDAKSNANSLFLGKEGAENSSTGDANTSVGMLAMASNTSGANNVAVGTKSLFSNTQAEGNTALGAYTLWNNTTGADNVAVGQAALASGNVVFRNTAVGKFALLTSTGSYNTAVGYDALSNVHGGKHNTAIGESSQRWGINEDSASLGKQSMELFQGNKNTVIGTQAGRGGVNRSGNNNTIIGYKAAYSIADNTSNNIVIGAEALADETQGSGNLNSSNNIYLGNNMMDHTTYYKKYDVNNSGAIDQADGQAITNCLNRNGGCNNLTYDTSGDGTVSALDALIIINFLNKPKNAINKIAIGNNLDVSTMPNNSVNIADTIHAYGTGNFGPYVKIGKGRDEGVDFEVTGFSTLGGGASIVDHLKLFIPGRGANKVLVSKDNMGNAEWKSLSDVGGASDNLGNHTATEDLKMENKKILNSNKIVVGPTQGLGSIYVQNPDTTAFGTQIVAAINKSDGWAEFDTLDKDTNQLKWRMGSTGDTRGAGFGGPNSFYIHQKSDKNDAVVDLYRLHITDTGNVSIGGTNATEKLEVAGKVKATGLQVTTDAGAGKVLTSDASGNATWQSGGADFQTYLTNSNFVFHKQNQTNIVGSGNVAFGTVMYSQNNTRVPNGNNNTSIGMFNFNQLRQGSDNAAIGTGALSVLIEGDSNTGVGGNALNIREGERNTAVGRMSGPQYQGTDTSYVKMDNNVFLGYISGVSSRGSRNVMLGASTLQNFVGNDTICIGYNCGNSVYQGSNNILIGTGVNYIDDSGNQPSSLAYRDYINIGNIITGFNSATNQSIKVRGNLTATKSIFAKENVWVDGQLMVTGSAHKTGGGSWSNLSDIRLKDVHGDYQHGLKEILNLNTVRFSYKKDNPKSLPSNTKEIGFIAQEVQKVIPEAVTEGEDGYLEFNMHPINVAMVNAVKELKAENDVLKDELKDLKSLLCQDHPNASVCK